MKLHSFIYLLLSIFICFQQFACNQNLTADELEKYINNPANGIKKSCEAGSFKAEVIYRPTDLIVNQELINNKEEDRVEVKKKYEQYLYFVLNMSTNSADLLNSTAASKPLFASVNEQLSFNLNQYVYMLNEKNDTSYLMDFTFPRLYEAAKATSVLLVFKSDQLTTPHFKICLKNIAYTGGILEFPFDKNDLKNIPSLKF